MSSRSKLRENAENRIGLVNNALLFYIEYMIGYSESVREPLLRKTDGTTGRPGIVSQGIVPA